LASEAKGRGFDPRQPRHLFDSALIPSGFFDQAPLLHRHDDLRD
jgi:hypothetical protein